MGIRLKRAAYPILVVGIALTLSACHYHAFHWHGLFWHHGHHGHGHGHHGHGY